MNLTFKTIKYENRYWRLHDGIFLNQKYMISRPWEEGDCEEITGVRQFKYISRNQIESEPNELLKHIL